MNLDNDEECACDVGPFESCPVCSRLNLDATNAKTPLRRRKKYDTPSAAEAALHYQKLAKEVE